GRGLVRPSAAAVLCREAPRIVAELERLGVRFDLDPDGGLALGLEGGHSKRRVVHAGGSATGRRVVRHLSALVAEDPRIHVPEAIRGEGATILDHDGERFVEELAPRDEVARAIEAKMRETGKAHVWLDMRAIDPGHFPNVVAALQDSGLDPATELVPVSPAAH